MGTLASCRRVALVGLIAAAVAGSGTAGAEEKTLKVVMHSDLKSLDPVWSGAYIVRNHGYLVYDTLFALDAKFQVQPQMAESWRQSEDGLVTTITLRPGLLWHDGTPVTAEDCVASLKRWQARDAMGQKLAGFLKEYSVIDERTFAIVLKERFGPLLEAIGKPSVVVPFMMPKRVAQPMPSSRSATTRARGHSSCRKTNGSPASGWSTSGTPIGRAPSRRRGSLAAKRRSSTASSGRGSPTPRRRSTRC
jgi:peptide/nickel transport system substrate-binding protein